MRLSRTSRAAIVLAGATALLGFGGATAVAGPGEHTGDSTVRHELIGGSSSTSASVSVGKGSGLTVHVRADGDAGDSTRYDCLRVSAESMDGLTPTEQARKIREAWRDAHGEVKPGEFGGCASVDGTTASGR